MHPLVSFSIFGASQEAPRARRRLCGLTALLLGALLAGAVGCSETPAEKLERLRGLVAEDRTDEALEEINRLLTETNKELSTPLNEERVQRSLKQSLDGRAVAWVQQQEIRYRDAQQTDRVLELPAPARDFNLSSSGSFAVAHLERADEDSCTPVVADFRAGRILRPEIEVDLPCYQTPAVAEDGQFLYYADKNRLHILRLQPDASPPGAENVPEKLPALKPKYDKLSNRMALYQAGQRGLLIFFGAAGYYDLYHYPGSGDDIERIETDVARPRLYSVFTGQSMADPLNPEEDEAAGESIEGATAKPVQTQGELSPEERRLARAEAFFFSGGAGRWDLRPLRYSGKPEADKGIRTRPRKQMIFVRDRGEFLTLRGERMYYWDPLENQARLLPLLARQFELFEGGLVYVDLLDRVYLRSAPFSELEIELAQLREEILRARGQADDGADNSGDDDASGSDADDSES